MLKVDEKTGCSDIAMDPRDPNTLYAGMWPLLIHPWNLDGGGPTGGVYITRDGGATWQKAVGHGMPAADHPVGKVAVAVAHSDPHRVYALVQDTQPTLYRSDDRGNTWTLVSHSHLMVQRDSYYVRFGVSTNDPDRLYFLSPNYVISLDAGKTFVRPNTDGFASAGGDNHDMWIDPGDANRIMVANDAGASISLDGSRSFEAIRLPIAQVYHVTTDDQIPYNIYGNIQDGNSFRGPSNNLQTGGFGGGGIHAADFQSVGGCESGFATPDPSDNDVVWSGCYEGVISRINLRDGQVRDVSVWPDVADGWTPKDVKYRWHWTVPLEISPFDSKRVYVGSQFVHETADGGQTWKTISPDLTLNDKSHQGDSGGISFDNLYTYDGDVIYSIAESPKKAGMIWVGTNDGQVSLTEDGGAHWTNVTKADSEPAAVRHDLEHRAVAVRRGDRLHHGQPRADGRLQRLRLQDGRLRQVVAVHQRRRAEGVQQLGALRHRRSGAQGHAVSRHRQRRLRLMGRRRALDLAQQQPAAGAGLLADGPEALQRSGHLDLRARRLRAGRRDGAARDGQGGERKSRVSLHAAAGVPVPFDRQRPHVRAGRAHRRSEPAVRRRHQLLSARGRREGDGHDRGPGRQDHPHAIATHGQPGVNRVWWDLRGENGKMPHMLVPPVGAEWMQNGPEGYHILRGIMIPNEVRGPLTVPGTYTVHLTAGGKTLTAPLTVLADPHSLGTPATLKAEEAFETQMIGEVDQVSDMIEHLEWVRQQVATLDVRYKSDPSLKSLLDEATKLAERATAIEGKLIDVYLTDGHEDLNRHPSQLYQKLTSLYDKSQADQGPTAADLDVNRFFREWMEKSKADLDKFATDVSAFNESVRAHHLTMTIQP